MKNLMKNLTLVMISILIISPCFAFQTGKIEKLIKNSPYNESATIAVSIKEADSNNIVYEQNSKKLLHPASVLKVFTTYSALDTLGYDYNFNTGFYKDKENNLYIKLGADPILTTAQIRNAFKNLKEQGLTSFNNLYFDDSILDKKEFAPGWMWDDDVNPYTPKVSAYNLDKNIIKVNFINTADGKTSVEKKSKFPMTILTAFNQNNEKDYIEINRYNWNTPEVVEISGNVSKTKEISIPLSSMRRYFIYTVEKALEDNNINIQSTLYASKLLPAESELLYEIKSPITTAIPLVLQNSDNLMAETIFKLAGGKKYNTTGTEENAIKTFTEFCTNKGIDTKSIIIKDGSGVSRNNLVTADWLTNSLNKLYKDKDFKKFEDYMAQSGDGTLSKRLYDLRGEARFKTGSLSNVSTIIGLVKSKDGKTYSFAILTQNFTQSQSEIKAFEDNLITLIYNQ